MNSSPVIDLDTSLGRPAGRGIAQPLAIDPARLLRMMDDSGVDLAATYHVVAKEHAADLGNRLLIDELAGHERLLPVFVLLPPFTGEQPEIPELMDLMAVHRVRFARLFPASSLDGHRFALREWCIGPVLGALEEAQIAVGVDFSLFRRGEPPWDDVVEICSKHPDLRLALMDVQGRNNRNLYALLHKFPNLYVSSSGLNVHSGLEDICQRFGADRLFLGSNAPSRSMQAARFVVDRAGLSEHDRVQILSGTAAGLLGLTRTTGADE